jgi:RNA polymerase sigma factor (sigma-70 family)
VTTAEYNSSVEAYSDRVYRFILKNIRDEDEAKDIVQDVYEKLWRKAEDVSFHAVRSYLFTAAYHTMLDRIKKMKRTEPMGEEMEEMVYHEKQYSDIKAVLNLALQKLPEDQRMVLLLRDYEGYSYQEIGEIANLNESQVKVYIYRARMAMRAYLGKPEHIA